MDREVDKPMRRSSAEGPGAVIAPELGLRRSPATPPSDSGAEHVPAVVRFHALAYLVPTAISTSSGAVWPSGPTKCCNAAATSAHARSRVGSSGPTEYGCGATRLTHWSRADRDGVGSADRYTLP